MKLTRPFVLALCIAFSACASAVDPTAETLPPGRHRISLEGPDGDLPFLLEIDERGSVSIRNGDERIPVPEVRRIEDPSDITGSTTRQLFRFDRDSSLVFTGSETGEIRGEWRLNRGSRGVTTMPARVDLNAESRFPDRARTEVLAPSTALATRYEVRFSSSEDPATASFVVLDGGVVHANFRTTLGDYRYLAGRLDGDQLRLSCFDGHHAFLFHARVEENGDLEGDFWSRDSWHETWNATPNPEADLPDTFAVTEWSTSADPSSVQVTALDGSTSDLGSLLDDHRPTVLIAFGSWCPNCHDATRLWAELEKRDRARGLRVVGLAFELSDDSEHELQKLREFRRRQGIDFELYLTGLADKDEASAALPVLDRVRAYPTTVFRNRQGEVLAVHTGFDGPATGEAHAALRARFENLLEQMLGTPASR